MSIFVWDKDGNRKKIAGLGLPGPTGKSAYQYAVEGGFTGTEAEFAALQGAISNPNLLDNWYFADPINQRGQTEYTTTGYTIDRYFLTGSGSLTIEDEGIVIVGTGDGVSFHIIVEQPYIIPGEVYTLSVLVDHLDGTGAIAQWATPQPTLVEGMNTLTFTAYADSWHGTSILLDLVGTAKLRAAKLELGPVQTLAHQDASGNWVLNDPPPNKAQELAKCQRYQVVYNLAKWQIFAYGMLYNASGGNFMVNIPVPMRSRPALAVISGPLSITANGNSCEDFTVSDPVTAAIVNSADTYVVLQINGIPTLTSYVRHGAILQTGAGNCQIILDANL